MSAITAKKLRESIKEILKGSDLSALSAKKVRRSLEDQFECDLTHRKKEIDEILMEMVDAAQNGSDGDASPKKAEKRAAATESSGEEEEEEEDDEGDEDVARRLQEEDGRPSRKVKKKPAAKRAKKADDDDDKPKKKSMTGYMKPCRLSPELASVMGEKKLPRSDVVKRMWAYIKENNLQDPKNKQFMFPDAALKKVFGDEKRIKCFGMMKYLKSHIFVE